MNSPFRFPAPLKEGIIVKRNSQFTMTVRIEKQNYLCHCPTTGRIGNISLTERPCLLSKSTDSNRKTAFTVEAISLNHPEDSEKSWIGINQNAVNRYVEHFLINGGFADLVGLNQEIRREQILGNSKLDFLIGDAYLEVKMPLQHLQLEIPDYVNTKKVTPFSSTDRFVKHITELGNSLQSHQRAILLTCFIYDNPGFQVIEKSTHYEEVSMAVAHSIVQGVETWQANFKITPEEVVLKRFFKFNI